MSHAVPTLTGAEVKENWVVPFDLWLYTLFSLPFIPVIFTNLFGTLHAGAQILLEVGMVVSSIGNNLFIQEEFIAFDCEMKTFSETPPGWQIVNLLFHKAKLFSYLLL